MKISIYLTFDILKIGMYLLYDANEDDVAGLWCQLCQWIFCINSFHDIDSKCVINFLAITMTTLPFRAHFLPLDHIRYNLWGSNAFRISPCQRHKSIRHQKSLESGRCWRYITRIGGTIGPWTVNVIIYWWSRRRNNWRVWNKHKAQK